MPRRSTASASTSTGSIVGLPTMARIIPPATAAAPPETGPHVVLGIVRRTDGTPVADVVVDALEVRFRQDERLGEGRTDREGRYAIEYLTRDDPNQRTTRDLRVRVHVPRRRRRTGDAGRMSHPLQRAARSGHRRAGQGRRETTMRPMRRTSRWSREHAGDVSPAEFTLEDLRVLAGEDTHRGVAGSRGWPARIGTAAATSVPAPAFVGLFSHGSPTRLGALLMERSITQRQATGAIDRRRDRARGAEERSRQDPGRAPRRAFASWC